MNTTGVTASLIAWNDRELLLRCLRSLYLQTIPPDNVLITDNASSDGSAEAVLSEFPTVTVLRPGTNLGYAGAHNLAFTSSEAPLFLVLNSDIVLAPDFLARLLAAMDADLRLGAVGGLLLRARSDGGSVEPPVVDSAGIERDWRGRFVDLGEDSAPDRVGGQSPFGVCGAAALFRRAAIIDSVPPVENTSLLFDPDFFAYYEDADLAWHLNRRGWKSRVVHDAIAWHIRGGSGAPSRLAQHLLHRNALWVLLKHATLRDFMYVPGWFFYEAWVLFSTTFRRELVRTQIERIRGAPRMMRKRRAIRTWLDRGRDT